MRSRPEGLRPQRIFLPSHVPSRDLPWPGRAAVQYVLVARGGSGGRFRTKNFVSTALHDTLHTAVAYCGQGNKSAAIPCSCSLILPKAPCSFTLHTQPARELPRQLLMPTPRVHFTPRGQGSGSSQEVCNLEVGFVTIPWTTTTVVTVRIFG